MEKSTIILIAAVGGAIALALVYSQNTSSNTASATTTHAATNDTTQALPQEDNAMEQQELPPNHPPIGGGNTGAMPMPNAQGGMGGMAAPDEPAAIAWRAPTAWPSAPNPNAMRLETHKIPHAPTDKEDAELIIARAGGDVPGNIARWTGQFDGAYAMKQASKTVHEMKVTRVEIEGTFTGGGMMPGGGAAAASHAGWVMLAAIVESKGQPYFFKVVGPAATVHAAEKSFDAMIDGLTPS